MIRIEYVPPINQYRAKCKCGCVFTFDENDRHQRCYGHGSFYDVIQCPICHNLISGADDYGTIEQIDSTKPKHMINLD